MQIGVFAARAGVPAKTIRYYESIALLPPSARDANGYRSYQETDLTLLLLIKRLRLAGVGLNELKAIINVTSEHCSTVRDRLAPVVNNRLVAIDRQIAELSLLHADLLAYRDDLRAPASTSPDPDVRFCDCDPATCGCRGGHHG
ncbi:MAG: MerR family transcriptional regulator [Thermomicrobiales bacterium]